MHAQDLVPVSLRPMNRVLRVCFVAPHAYPLLARERSIRFVGGAEVQQTVLAKALAARGHDVSMICLDHGQPEGVRIDGVRVHTAFRNDAGIPIMRFLHPRLTGLWRAMQRADAEVYYQRAAGMLTGVVAEFGRRHGRNSVYAGANDSDFIPGRPPIPLRRDRWLFEYGLRHVTALLAQNPVQQTLCQRHYGRHAELARSCYVPPPAARRDAGGHVLWVSTLRRFKRPEFLLAVARELPDVRFRMVGGPGSGRAVDMDYYRAIEHEAARLGNVEFAGFVPFMDVERQFDSARLLVNTSEEEGFPNTFLQAWARGIPTVTTFDTGVPPRGAPICTLVPDVPAACAAIRTLWTDSRTWEAQGDRCRRYYLARHTPDTVVPALERFLGSL